MKKINDGFKMWANYLEAIDSYTKNDDAQFGRFMRILCYYGIYGEEIAETEIEKLFFTGVKSSIDASVQNIKNGMLGGRGNKQTTEPGKRPTLEEVEGHPNCNPHIFLINDRPTQGFGSMTAEQSQKMWDRNMTQFFASFSITEGDFEPAHWIGKVGEITVQQQKKNTQYNEIVPYKTKPRAAKKEVTTHTDNNNVDAFPEDVPDIF